MVIKKIFCYSKIKEKELKRIESKFEKEISKTLKKAEKVKQTEEKLKEEELKRKEAENEALRIATEARMKDRQKWFEEVERKFKDEKNFIDNFYSKKKKNKIISKLFIY